MKKIGTIYIGFVKICSSLLVILIIVAIFVYWLDSARLSKLASKITEGEKSEAGKISEIANYVTNLEGDLGDEGYFLSPIFAPLKPSACQIIDEGGDCAFKARAFIVLMNKLGVSASKLCLHDSKGIPRHAVARVDAEVGLLIADLSFGILYLHEDGSPMTVEYIADHLAAIIKEQVRRGNKQAAKYPLERYPFNHVTTINWEKDSAWRSARILLSLFISEESINNVPRPYFSEEPALMIVIASGLGLTVLLFPILSIHAGYRVVDRFRRQTIETATTI